VRAELRCPDPSANPYLALTVMLAAALDGIDRKLAAPNPLNNVNIYHLTADERKALNIGELPGSLAEALREMERDDVIKNALGTALFDAFHRAKWAEVEENRMKVTDWELDRYLETA
jgi:glutamine synthetase